MRVIIRLRLKASRKPGHDFADENSDTEELYLEREERAEQKVLMRRLKAALPFLTEVQCITIHKLFVLNMSQAEIAREEAVSEQAISDFSLISEGTNNISRTSMTK